MLVSLLRHMEWADARVWAATAGLDAPDARLHRLLYHLHGTQRAFLQIWQAAPVDLPHEKDFADLPAIREWARGYYRDAMAIVSAADEAQMQKPTIMPWADSYTERFGRKASPTTFEDTALQITSHSTYHRGQVNARLKELGAEPPLVDYIAWLWLGRPEAEW